MPNFDLCPSQMVSHLILMRFGEVKYLSYTIKWGTRQADSKSTFNRLMN